MKSFKNFLLYNNTVPIVFGVLFLGTTATFAASPEARDAVVRSETALTSVDNSYIRSVNINSYGFEVYVDSIEENDTTYFVTYIMETIDLVDGSWQPVNKQLVLEVSKEALEDNDLGTYVSKQLADVYNGEIVKLKETQEIEKKLGASDKVITKKYDGIIGKMLDPENEAFPGYRPVVVAPPAIPGELPKKEKPVKFEKELNNGEVVVIESPTPTPPAEEPNGTTTPEVITEVGTTSPPTEVEPPAPEEPPEPIPEELVEEPAPAEVVPEEVVEEPAPEPEPVPVVTPTEAPNTP